MKAAVRLLWFGPVFFRVARTLCCRRKFDARRTAALQRPAVQVLRNKLGHALEVTKKLNVYMDPSLPSVPNDIVQPMSGLLHK